MRAVVQRVTEASVTIDDVIVGKIDQGLLVLVGIKADDTEKDMDYIISKITGLRIFSDEQDKMNLSVQDIGGKILIVPNFTLYGNATKGMRPSFIASGSPSEAKEKYNIFIQKLREKEVLIETGEFQADMKVSLLNDGPVTILLDSSKII